MANDVREAPSPERKRVRVQLHYGERTIEERFARVAYRGYEIAGHGSQSFERVHERGGFGLEELVHYAFIAGRGSKVPYGKELDG